MIAIELYTNNKTYYPFLKDNAIYIDNIVMKQLYEEDFSFFDFDRDFTQTRNEKKNGS